MFLSIRARAHNHEFFFRIAAQFLAQFILPISSPSVTVKPRNGPRGHGSKTASTKTRAKDSAGTAPFLPVNKRTCVRSRSPPQAFRMPDPDLSGFGPGELRHEHFPKRLRPARHPRFTPEPCPEIPRFPFSQWKPLFGQFTRPGSPGPIPIFLQKPRIFLQFPPISSNHIPAEPPLSRAPIHPAQASLTQTLSIHPSALILQPFPPHP